MEDRMDIKAVKSGRTAGWQREETVLLNQRGEEAKRYLGLLLSNPGCVGMDVDVLVEKACQAADRMYQAVERLNWIFDLREVE